MKSLITGSPASSAVPYDTFPLVAIIVLTWNQRDLTLDCLTSLSEMNYPADRLQIIVVDNGSSDDTAAAVRERFPHAIVLENDDNLGFAEGNNVGIRYALQGEAEYIMLLNNDTVVDRQMLAVLIQTAELDPLVGVVTPKIYYFDDPKRIWCAGASVNWKSGNITRLQAEQIDGSLDGTPSDVDFASGCAICCKRRTVEEIGFLDPRFYFYFEETDWCMRARAAGWRISYEPRAQVWHHISATIGTSSPATDYYMTRNVLLFLSKNLSGLPRLLTLARVAGSNALAIAAYTVKSHGGARRHNRDARLLALRDAVLGRWGRMGQDAAAVCYPVILERCDS